MSQKSPAKEAIIALARELYEDESIMVHEEVTIPDLEPDDRGGAWVDASVWVPFDKLPATPDVTLSLRWTRAVRETEERVHRALAEIRRQDPDDLILKDKAAYDRHRSASDNLTRGVSLLAEWLEGKTTSSIYGEERIRRASIQEAIRTSVQTATAEDPRLKAAAEDVLKTLALLSRPTPMPEAKPADA